MLTPAMVSPQTTRRYWVTGQPSTVGVVVTIMTGSFTKVGRSRAVRLC